MKKGDKMFDKLLGISPSMGDAPKENDVYKVIEIHGKRFEIRYGYYEDIDREYEPVPIYPDFIKEPIYSDDGAPFAVAWQDVCEHYKAKREERTVDDTCSDCIHYEKCEELLGICTCSARRSNPQDK